MTKQKRSKVTPTPNTPLARLTAWFQQPGRDVDVIILVFVALIALAAFANTINGEFVYDDTRQILQNPIVRERDQFWDAFTTDVWAFKSGGTDTVSDYWRPAFILWLIVNERLFGLDSTAGWHLSNIFLHIATAVMAYIVLGQLKITRPIKTAVVLIFALHPAHVETVAWISGSPDLLMALSVLGAVSLLLAHQKTADRRRYVAALFLFIVALLSKEAAILLPFLVILIHLFWVSKKETPLIQKAKAAGLYVLPFLIIAILYLAVRIAILGHLAANRPWQQPLFNVILTIPSVIAFYLRQSIFPLQLGPSYPLRIISPNTINLQNFWLPLLFAIMGLTLLSWLTRRSRVKQFGLALFFLFLLPSFNVNAFHPEQIVHDRYLYLPLLGFLIIAVFLLNQLVEIIVTRSLSQSGERAQFTVLTLIITAVLCLPLLVQTVQYNNVWKSDLALWTRGVQSDPTSLFNRYQYGYYLLRNGRLNEARAEMDEVIINQPLSGPYYSYLQAVEAYLERADIGIQQERFEDARADLTQVISLSPTNLSDDDRANLDAQQQRAFERLALSYVQDGDSVSAIETLENARQTLPNLTCTFTTNLAVTLYLSGQKDKALTELETVQERVELENTPLCKMSLFYLGQLYLELGRTAEARSNLFAFLAASQSFYDPQTINLRQQATQYLGQN